MNIVFRSLSVGLCLCASFAATNLSAAEYVSRNIKVPFAFTVGKVTLPAGEYRVRQEPGKEIVSIVNVQTCVACGSCEIPASTCPDGQS